MTREEAGWLAERVIESAPETLLADFELVWE